MSTQVAPIGGLLLQNNLQRELADPKFDNDPVSDPNVIIR